MTDTEPLLDQLIDVGNKALADHYHEDLCSCSTWPDACASNLKPFTWDTNAFAIALPAILTAYEAQRPADRPPHTYLSTGCHHGRHDYCQATEGQAGPKDPAKCKWCPSRCVCPCHTDTAPPADAPCTEPGHPALTQNPALQQPCLRTGSHYVHQDAIGNRWKDYADGPQ